MNLYAFTANRPLSFLDWLGLFDLEFKGEGWTAEKKEYIERAFEGANTRISDVIKRLTVLLCLAEKLPCSSDATPRDNFVEQLEKLKQKMNTLLSRLKSSDKYILTMGDLGEGTYGQEYIFFDKMKLNTNPKNNFFDDMNKFSGRVEETFYHELSHIVGTRDSGPVLNDAHYLDDVLFIAPSSFTGIGAWIELGGKAADWQPAKTCGQ